MGSVRETIKRWTRIQPNELPLVLGLGALLTTNFMALEIANVVAVSGFLSQVGIDGILIVWIIDMLLVMGIAAAQSLIVDRMTPKRLMRWMLATFAAIYAVLLLLFRLQAPATLNYTLLYLLADQHFFFFPVIFWILAQSQFTLGQVKRIFPLLAAFGFGGQIIGLGVSAWAGTWRSVAPEWLLVINIGAFVAVFLLLQRLPLAGTNQSKRRKTDMPPPIRETLREAWDFISNVPSFRYLTVAMAGAAIVLTLFEFHFLRTSSQTFTSQQGFQTFFGSYKLGLTLLAIGLQVGVTGRLLEKLSIRRTFFALPSLLLLVSLGALLWPGIWLAATARGIGRLAFGTVDESARKAFQALVPEARRGRVSLFMDGYLLAGGTLLGSILIGVTLGLEQLGVASSRFLTLAAAALVAAICMGAIFKMSAVYEKSLLNWRLKRRKRGSSILEGLDL